MTTTLVNLTASKTITSVHHLPVQWTEANERAAAHGGEYETLSRLWYADGSSRLYHGSTGDDVDWDEVVGDSSTEVLVKAWESSDDIPF